MDFTSIAQNTQNQVTQISWKKYVLFWPWHWRNRESPHMRGRRVIGLSVADFVGQAALISCVVLTSHEHHQNGTWGCGYCDAVRTHRGTRMLLLQILQSAPRNV
jgi:hypothetical protein